ncbi:extensin-1-like isoform X2 [Varroa jacobsoni]|uniref:extensin-1-like isoform X2 n=1 Tax=Varroa jacobsoni TaxID=62625 RepID=UPI000BF723D3|nr:extensin-1-like isoform X2 [Varroa jacobsoni]
MKFTTVLGAGLMVTGLVNSTPSPNNNYFAPFVYAGRGHTATSGASTNAYFSMPRSKYYLPPIPPPGPKKYLPPPPPSPPPFYKHYPPAPPMPPYPPPKKYIPPTQPIEKPMPYQKKYLSYPSSSMVPDYQPYPPAPHPPVPMPSSSKRYQPYNPPVPPVPSQSFSTILGASLGGYASSQSTYNVQQYDDGYFNNGHDHLMPPSSGALLPAYNALPSYNIASSSGLENRESFASRSNSGRVFSPVSQNRTYAVSAASRSGRSSTTGLAPSTTIGTSAALYPA